MGMMKFKVMSLTDAAARRVREIMDNADRPLAGVRVGVRNGGCAGMAYTLDLVETPNAADDKVEEKGVTVFVEPKAVLFLLGSVMDFEIGKMSTGFTFRNPNEVSACGCGELVNLKAAELPGHAHSH